MAQGENTCHSTEKRPLHNAILTISPLFYQLFRYGLVSAVALVVDMGLLFVLTEYVYIHYLLSATIAFCCGLLLNYILSVRLVFGASKMKRSHEFLCYALIGVGGLLLNDGIIYLLVTLNWWYMLAKIVATAAGFFFNFFCRRCLFVDGTRKEGF